MQTFENSQRNGNNIGYYPIEDMERLIKEIQKRIMALKIVIYHLTPYFERTGDQPTFSRKRG
jgi:hypothetical protein